MAEGAEEKKETADTKARVHTYPLIRVSRIVSNVKLYTF